MGKVKIRKRKKKKAPVEDWGTTLVKLYGLDKGKRKQEENELQIDPSKYPIWMEYYRSSYDKVAYSVDINPDTGFNLVLDLKEGSAEIMNTSDFRKLLVQPMSGNVVKFYFTKEGPYVKSRGEEDSEVRAPKDN